MGRPASRRRLALLLVVAVLSAGCTVEGFRERVLDGRASSVAKDLVSGEKYPNLLVEIDHPADARPSQAAVDVLKRTLEAVTGKERVEVRLDASIPSETRKYSDAELRALEAAHRGSRTGGDTAVLYVLYVAGGHAEDTDEGVVLGLNYRGTSTIVMFKGNIRDSSCSGTLCPVSGKPRLDEVERAVLVHEFGHAAGLVNAGTEMVTPREDADHPGHSRHEDSVMYWAVENTRGLLNILGSGIPYEFDEHDKADLEALRGS